MSVNKSHPIVVQSSIEHSYATMAAMSDRLSTREKDEMEPKPTISDARTAAKEWVWCQGWSPQGGKFGREGAFGRPMPRHGYPGETQYDVAGACAAELRHSASGCKNVTTAPLSEHQIEQVAHRILEERLKRYDSRQPHREKWAAANAYFGKCNMSMVEIGNDLAHIHRFSDGRCAVIELVGGKWIARDPQPGERIYV